MSADNDNTVIANKRARIDATHRFQAGRTALLLIDMQTGFLHPEAALAVPPAWDIVPTLQRVLAFFRQRQMPVIFTAFVADPRIPTLRVDPFGIEHLPPIAGQPTGFGHPSGNCQRDAVGPESPEIIPELAPLPSEPVIQGYSLDKFYGAPLDQVLRARDIRCLLMGGVMTDLCVLATLFSATTREYRVTLLEDGVATLWPDIQKATLDIVARKLGRVLSARAALAELDTLAS